MIWLLPACSKESGNPQEPASPVRPADTVKLFINLPAGWKYSSILSSAYRQAMQVYTFDTIFENIKTRAFCVAWDSKAGILDFKPVQHNPGQKTSSFFTSEPSAIACINGGYFGGGQSYSTVKYNNQVLAPNIKSVNRNLNGTSTAYYPTRASFGIFPDGKPSLGWIYHEGAQHQIIYKYPAPSPNAEGNDPQPVPGNHFPQGGEVWNVTSAIGGSPVLLYNDEIKITDKEELISVNNLSPRPRSAIGYNKDGIIMMIAVEGDNASAGYLGLNLPQLARMLKTLSLSYAMNLDGGGSTSLVINNQLMVRPGDNGNERSVVSAIVLRRK